MFTFQPLYGGIWLSWSYRVLISRRVISSRILIVVTDCILIIMTLPFLSDDISCSNLMLWMLHIVFMMLMEIMGLVVDIGIWFFLHYRKSNVMSLWLFYLVYNWNLLKSVIFKEWEYQFRLDNKYLLFNVLLTDILCFRTILNWRG